MTRSALETTSNDTPDDSQSTSTMYIDDGRSWVINGQRGMPSTHPNNVIIEMQRWIVSRESKWIWIQGVDTSSYISKLSSAALRICELSTETGLPCIAFFGQPRYSTTCEKLTNKQKGLIALLYSVISQLTCLVSITFEVTPGLDEKHYSLLDGGMQGVPAALDLIRALLTKAPRSLI